MVKNWEEKSDVKEIAKALAFAQTGKILIILKHFRSFCDTGDERKSSPPGFLVITRDPGHL